jgi:hypothetical protein
LQPHVGKRSEEADNQSAGDVPNDCGWAIKFHLSVDPRSVIGQQDVAVRIDGVSERAAPFGHLIFQRKIGHPLIFH